MSANVTFTLGTIAGSNCYTDLFADAQRIVDALTGTIPDNVTQLIIQDAEPGAPDRDKFWLRTSSGAPIELLLWLTSASKWVRVFSGVKYALSTGATGAYVITNSMAWDAYRTGELLLMKANHTTPGASTLNIDSLGAKTIYKNVNTALAASDILNNQICILVYDGTNFQLLNPAGGGTIAVGSIAPGTDGQFLSTVSGAAAWQTRLYATADASGQSIPGAGSTVTIAHGLGARPKIFSAMMICVNGAGDIGYALNEVVPITNVTDAEGSDEATRSLTCSADATNIYVTRGSDAVTLWMNNKSSGLKTATITESRWRIIGAGIL